MVGEQDKGQQTRIRSSQLPHEKQEPDVDRFLCGKRQTGMYTHDGISSSA